MTKNIKSKPAVSLREIAETANLLNDDNHDTVTKYGDLSLDTIETPSTGKPGSIIFIEDKKFTEFLKNTNASAIVLKKKLLPLYEMDLKASQIPFLIAENAKLALAYASHLFVPDYLKLENNDILATENLEIDPTAVISPRAVLYSGVKIGPNSRVHSGAVLGTNVTIGAGCEVFPNAVIYHDCIVGDRVRIHSNATIGADGFGYAQEKSTQGFKHVKIAHLGKVIIGNDSEIGANASIDRGTIGDTHIGKNCVIDNQVQIGHNCDIGDGTIICGCCGLAGSTKVGKFVIIAGLSGTGDGAVIGDGAIVTGMTGVEKNVPPGAVYSGNPSRPKGEFFRIHAALTKLPDTMKKINKMMKEN